MKNTLKMLRDLKNAFNSSNTSKQYEDKAWDIYIESNVPYDIFVQLKKSLYNCI